MIEDIPILQGLSHDVWLEISGLVSKKISELPAIGQKDEKHITKKRLDSGENGGSGVDGDFRDIQSVEFDPSESAWPRKIHITHKDLGEYEVIFSELGSITLRPNSGKKQPIFYMSLRKQEDGKFVWEDGDRNPKTTETWMELFQMAWERVKKIPPVARG